MGGIFARENTFDIPFFFKRYIVHTSVWIFGTMLDNFHEIVKKTNLKTFRVWSNFTLCRKTIKFQRSSDFSGDFLEEKHIILFLERAGNVLCRFTKQILKMIRPFMLRSIFASNTFVRPRFWRTSQIDGAAIITRLMSSSLKSVEPFCSRSTG